MRVFPFLPAAAADESKVVPLGNGAVAGEGPDPPSHDGVGTFLSCGCKSTIKCRASDLEDSRDVRGTVSTAEHFATGPEPGGVESASSVTFQGFWINDQRAIYPLPDILIHEVNVANGAVQNIAQDYGILNPPGWE